MPSVRIPQPFQYSDITTLKCVIVTETMLVADGYIQETPVIAHFNFEKQKPESIVRNWTASDLIIG